MDTEGASNATVTTDITNAGTGTSAGNVTAVSDVGDGTVMTCVGNVGMGTSACDMTAVSDVSDERCQ